MKVLKSLILIISALSILLVVGCGSGGDEQESTTTTSTASQSGTKKKRSDVPAWFLVPPTAEDAIYTVGYAKKENMQLAMDTAKNRARDEISRVIGVKVSNMIKDFLEQGGVGETQQSIEFTQSVSKSVSQNFISGSKLEQQELYDIEQDGKLVAHEAFVLMKVSLKDMSSKIDDLMKNNAAAYAKLQANKAFDDLSKELKSLNGNDSDLKPVVPEEGITAE
ncbi:MAG: hypothetical protein A2086_03390 [Spirochaetes bacterium GWD1_27_9]|nr:MAG: hypothetical protein A2Z98_14760 [Spirochaetes bacterium GWB1_27_13]OHD25947.1 MAG: hypothetical protein A2Y34_14405 [Spirochaetes bacterium GWC1_27_15]OHD45219.1 MAG: hypothetical protein A2086_03390 [Spirochaetes bacterium GWD1_27_9]